MARSFLLSGDQTRPRTDPRQVLLPSYYPSGFFILDLASKSGASGIDRNGAVYSANASGDNADSTTLSSWRTRKRSFCVAPAFFNCDSTAARSRLTEKKRGRDRRRRTKRGHF